MLQGVTASITWTTAVDPNWANSLPSFRIYLDTFFNASTTIDAYAAVQVLSSNTGYVTSLGNWSFVIYEPFFGGFNDITGVNFQKINFTNSPIIVEYKSPLLKKDAHSSAVDSEDSQDESSSGSSDSGDDTASQHEFAGSDEKKSALKSETRETLTNSKRFDFSISGASITFSNCIYIADDDFPSDYMILLDDSAGSGLTSLVQITNSNFNISRYRSHFINLNAKDLHFVMESTGSRNESFIEANPLVYRLQTDNNPTISFSFKSTIIGVSAVSLVGPAEAADAVNVNVEFSISDFTGRIPAMKKKDFESTTYDSSSDQHGTAGRRDIAAGNFKRQREASPIQIYESIGVDSFVGRRRSADQGASMDQGASTAAKTRGKRELEPFFTVTVLASLVTGLDLSMVDTLLASSSGLSNCWTAFGIRNVTLDGFVVLSFSQAYEVLPVTPIFELSNSNFHFLDQGQLTVIADQPYLVADEGGVNFTLANPTPSSACTISIASMKLNEGSDMRTECNTTFNAVEHDTEFPATIQASSNHISALPILSLSAGSPYSAVFDLTSFGMMTLDLGTGFELGPTENIFAAPAYFNSSSSPKDIHLVYNEATLGLPANDTDVYLFETTPSFNSTRNAVFQDGDTQHFTISYRPINATHSQVSYRVGSVAVVPSDGTPSTSPSSPSSPSTSPSSASPSSGPSSPSSTPSTPSASVPSAPVARGCDRSIPGFVCQDGVLISNHSITLGSNETFVIGTSPVTVTGNLTVGSLVFTNPGTTLTIEGCLNITHGTGVTIDLTQKTSVKGGRVILISQSSSCASSINNVPVSIKQSSKTCEKASFKPETTTSSSLVGTFVISRSSCDVKWIIIGSVLGAVVILAVIVIIVVVSVRKSKTNTRAHKALRQA